MQAVEKPAAVQDVDSIYKPEYYDRMVEGSLSSARVIVPLVTRLLEPKSVVDVGCGIGAWLKVFVEQGVEDIQGVDGDYVDRGRLLIDPSRFQTMDLSHPQSIARAFDLAISLEVGEHLPARVAPSFVKLLVDTSPLVLFSAAIPNQGGKYHINEQWPYYWKVLFARHGYVQLNPFRRHIGFDRRICWWYRQNMFLYASQEAINRSESLQNERTWALESDMEIISPQILSHYTSLMGLLSLIPGAAWRAVKNYVTVKRYGPNK